VSGDAQDRCPAEPAPPGGRLEQLQLVVQLLLDLAAVPFHMIRFVFTARRQRARLRADLTEPRS